MSLRLNLRGATAACALAATVVSGSAFASTITQNTSWTVTRSGATSTYRVVAYGDSIFAGYNGGLFSVGRRAQPYTSGEYLSQKWGANVEVVRRTKSGAKADDIYNNKIIGDKSYMQDAKTRVVMFEMCGNDYLQARSALADQSGTCDYSGLDNAYTACATYMEKAMQAINTYATSAKAKVIMNIYYPGFDADYSLTSCIDSATGRQIIKQDKFLPLLAKSNWKACSLAAQYGFQCADAFAEMMGSDYDSNGDGQIDVDGLRYVPGESEASYVNRIVSLRNTLRDANTHFTNASTSYDYIQSDNTHPTYYLSSTIGLNVFTGSGSGSGASDFADSQIVGGKNPQWNKSGHERSGWSISTYNPAAP
ncbi:MAG: SGNH/GDSL hydrolase family protein [Hyalangium sp.]|uniref:SGNH/GDSL hydrolase family protein n=1 Tax=Hyalangium sp. TaxID=2028555 RepID=UPI00389A17B7